MTLRNCDNTNGMMDTFLKSGYALFSWTHLLAMTVCLAFFLGMTDHFKKLNPDGRKRMLRRTSIMPVLLETVQDIILTFKHIMSVQYLPLHLCGQAIFIEAIHGHMREGRAKNKIGEMIFSLFLPGALMALVFPGWNNLPLLNGVSLKKYIAHFFLVLYGILIYIDGQVKLAKKNMWQELVYLYGVALLLWPFNDHFNTNYLYTHEPVDPLAFIWNNAGKPVYIFVMMIAGFVLVRAMYALDAALQKRHAYGEKYL